MKKKLALIAGTVMALSSMSMTAFAEAPVPTAQNGQQIGIAPPDVNATRGTAEVLLSDTEYYEVEIPSNVELDPDNGYTGTGEVKPVKMHLGYGRTVSVSMSGDFKLENEQESTITVDYTASVDGTTINSGDSVASFTTVDDEAVTIDFEADTPQYAGKYSDTLTFEVSCTSN